MLLFSTLLQCIPLLYELQISSRNASYDKIRGNKKKYLQIIALVKTTKPIQFGVLSITRTLSAQIVITE